MKKIFLFAAAVCCFIHSQAQSIIADYPFTNGSYTDVSGNSLNAIAHGSFSTAAGANGLLNNALVFNGTSFLTVPATSKTNLTNWSIMAHVKMYGFYSGTCQGNMILEHGSQNYFSNYYCMAVDDQQYDHNCNSYFPNKETPVALACNADYPSNPTYFISDTNYHVFICTYDSFSVKTYVDDTLISQISIPYSYNYGTADSLDWYIGGSSAYNVGYPDPFTGAMDRLVVFNGALNDTLVHFYSTYYDSTYRAPTSVANVKAKGDNYKLFPIPATNTLNLCGSNYQGAAQLTIFNIYGQKLYSQKVQLNSATTVTISVSGLNAGNYLLQITDNNGQTTKHFNKL